MQHRHILTPVSDATRAWILEQSLIHGASFNKALSAARITRSVLAGLAAAGAPVGAQPNAEAIEKWVANVFARYATETSQTAYAWTGARESSPAETR
jgi:hypothetical protein